MKHYMQKSVHMFHVKHHFLLHSLFNNLFFVSCETFSKYTKFENHFIISC